MPQIFYKGGFDVKLFDLIVGESESREDVEETVRDMLSGLVPTETVTVSKPNRNCHAVVAVRDNRYGPQVAKLIYA